MKAYQTDEIKNIALLGNASSGKTTLAEAMLFDGGVIERRGTIEGKNTVSDFNEVEQQYGNSLYSSLLYTEYQGKKINILDNPGLDDFVGSAVSSLYMADTGVLLLNAQNGVEVGSEIHFRWTDRFAKPVVMVVNHLDHEKSNFDKTVDMAREHFGNHVVLVQFPVNEGHGFNAMVDVMKMKLYRYSGDSGKAEILDIPADLKDKATSLHNQLVEAAAESDEKLMEVFFEKETLSEEEMRKGITTGLMKRGIFPVFCVSAKGNYGVDQLLEFIADTVPSCNQVSPMKTTDGKEVKTDPKAPVSLFVFKTSIESHIGEINYFKVLSGEVTEGIDLINYRTRNKERLAQLFVVAGKNRTRIPSLAAGDIGATVKLKGTKTNDTLTIPSVSFAFQPIPFPNPKYRVAIKSMSEGDEEKMGEALARSHDEDPTILVEYSKELKQIIVHGQGEHHLNILKWQLDNRFKIDTQYVAPKIPYRETITRVARADYRHKKQSGGAGQFGEVHLVIEPYVEGAPPPTSYKVGGKDIKISVRNTEEYDLEWGGKLVYYNCIVGGSIDARFMPAILKGIMEKMEVGPLTGSYARDIRIAVYDGKMHPVDSNEISFRLAGRNAFSQAFKNAGPKIMEPIYEVEVWVPSDRMGDVMSDLQTRRAIVLGMSSEKGFEVIRAKAPLAEMGKYSTALSSLTGGRAMYTMKFSEYTQVPPDIQEQLLKAYEAEQEEE